MASSTRSRTNHVDPTQVCPGCTRRFRAGTTVTVLPSNEVRFVFQSKLTGQWGELIVPPESISWFDKRPPTR